MNEDAFRRFLKRSGKKSHTIGELVNCVKDFESYLAQRQIVLDHAEVRHIHAYLETLDEIAVNEIMRALALYYVFAENHLLAKTASEIREQRIVKTRKPFKLREFTGVNLLEVAKLEAGGVITVAQMLEAGRTPECRRALAEQTGVGPEIILELVKLSDLTRLGAVKSVRARLYYDAGLDTPDKFIQWEPEALRQMLVEFVERSGFKGIPSLPKEIHNAIETAKTLPKLIEYD